MADNSMHLQELLGKIETEQDVDFLREAVRTLVHAIMREDVKNVTGAELYERTEGRSNYRNGYRERLWDTRVGTIPLSIPRTRCGSYFPAFLEPRRRSEKALVAVVQQAYVHGVSTRKVDDLAEALGIQRLDKSQVSRICKELDEVVDAFRNRPLDDKQYVYVWLDATYLKVRENGRVVSQAVVVAMGVTTDGDREILGFDVGPSESESFWLEFLRSLVRRGLKGVKLATSDCHVGLRKAIASVLGGAAWQRCRVHFMRNILSQVKKSYQAMVSASVRTIFMQPSYELAAELLEDVATRFEPKFPKVSELLWNNREDILAFYKFPSDHWRKIYSTNPLERLNKEIKRRCDVVGIFPNRASIERLVGAILIEQNDEWAVAKRYLPQRSMRQLLSPGEGADDDMPHFPDQKGLLAQR